MIKGTLLLDFDSTLIQKESLDLLLEEAIENPEELNALHEITEQAMNGEIDFRYSLAQRLHFLSCSPNELPMFGECLHDLITEGAHELIMWAQQHFSVKIVSGGLKAVICPVAATLGVSQDNVHAVSVKQNTLPLAACEDGFEVDKIHGLHALNFSWPKPIIAIGDGYTDYMLYEEGIADDFIAYLEHTQRARVIEKAPHHVRNMKELQSQLEKHL